VLLVALLVVLLVVGRVRTKDVCGRKRRMSDEQKPYGTLLTYYIWHAAAADHILYGTNLHHPILLLVLTKSSTKLKNWSAKLKNKCTIIRIVDQQFDR
jgi:hypothetical protein